MSSFQQKLFPVANKPIYNVPYKQRYWQRQTEASNTDNTVTTDHGTRHQQQRHRLERGVVIWIKELVTRSSLTPYKQITWRFRTPALARPYLHFTLSTVWSESGRGPKENHRIIITTKLVLWCLLSRPVISTVTSLSTIVHLFSKEQSDCEVSIPDPWRDRISVTLLHFGISSVLINSLSWYTYNMSSLEGQEWYREVRHTNIT